MKRRFFTLDVFTDRRFAGNPLAVVLDSQDLDTERMQAIAREFNHPETVFVFPPDDPAHRARLRIFTPAAEIPFAGHPTVGTAVLLGQLDSGGAEHEFILEETVGPISCRFMQGEGGAARARFVVPGLPRQDGAGPAAEAAAAALSVPVADIGFGGLTPSRWTAGLAFTYVPVRTLEAIGRCRPDFAYFEKAFAAGGPGKAFLYCAQAAEAGNDFHVRMFAPGMGIPEDPATGSAAAAFAGLLAASGRYKDGEHIIRIEQGYEMGRPSLIELSMTLRGGQLASAGIGGGAVAVTEGVISA